MKKIKYTYFVLALTVLTILLLAIDSRAQEFTVEKIAGKVNVLKGTGEEYESIQNGDKLSADDLLITDVNSFIQLSSGDNIFILRSNAALGLNHIRKVSINDLLLALTMEEIRKLPKSNGNNVKSTAVYGSEVSPEQSTFDVENSLGNKRLNGAKQLAENGYKESAVIVAKETYRKYPYTKILSNDRIYFADILFELNLLNEAFEEYKIISNLNLTSHQKVHISNKIKQLSLSLSGNE